MNIWIDKRRALLKVDVAGIVVCLVMSLAFFFVVFDPLIRQRSFFEDQRDKLAARSDESSSLSASMSRLGDQLATVEKELDQSKIRLGSSHRTNQRLAALTALFCDCSLAVDDIRAGKISAGQTWDAVSIGIDGSGEYAQCVTVLGKLREEFADMSLVRFGLEGNPAKSEEPERFKFQLLWHTAPEAKGTWN